MELLYGQNCGTYSTTLQAVDPDCDYSHLLTASAPSGSGGANSLQYSESMTLEYQGLDDSEVGQCEMEMVVSQVSANGDGFVDNAGVESVMDPVTYSFVVTVEPC